MSRLKKTIVMVSAVALTLGGAGVALAYWTSTGSGTGTAQSGVSNAFTIATDTVQGPPLVPGGPGQTVAFTVTNPGPATQYLGVVTVVVANADGSAWDPPTGCLAADYVPIISTAPTYGEMVTDDVQPGIATVTLTDTNVDQDACQGVAVPLYFAASS